MALITPHVAAHAGRFLRLDTLEVEGPFRAYLEACGLSLYRHPHFDVARAGPGSGRTGEDLRIGEPFARLTCDAVSARLSLAGSNYETKAYELN